VPLVNASIMAAAPGTGSAATAVRLKPETTNAASVGEVQLALITATPVEATSLARGIVDAHLAACVNILPGVTSVYQWQGKTMEDSEVLLVAKTRRSLVPEFIEHVERAHSYDVPEIVFIDVQGGLPAYLQWVLDHTNTRRPAASGELGSTVVTEPSPTDGGNV